MALVLTGPAGAADPVPTADAPPTSGPASASLRMAPEELGHRYEYDGRMTGLVNPACTVKVGEQARAAFAASLSRVFPGAAQPPELELTAAVSRAGVEPAAGGGGQAAVEHALTLRTRTGREVGSWRLRAEERIVGLDAEGLNLAFVRAARRSAAELERLLAGVPALAGAVVAPPAPPPPAPVSHRGPWVVYVEPGAAVLHPFGGGNLGYSLRAGFSGRWLLVQVSSEWRVIEKNGYFSRDPGTEVTAFAVDLGGVFQAKPGLELRGGVGLHRLAAREAEGDPALQRKANLTAASLFAGVLWVGTRGFEPLGIRPRATFGGRYYIPSTVEFAPVGTPGRSRPARSLDLGSLSLELSVGFEFPITRSP